MDFTTRYNHKPDTGEANNGPKIVESAGYINAKTRIENMMLAGQRLVDYRKAKYDSNNGEDIDDIPIDPTRSGSYDLADATMQMQNIENNLNESKKLVDEKPLNDYIEENDLEENVDEKDIKKDG